jgi:LemA protein
MKAILLAIAMSLALVSQGQDSLLEKSWLNLTSKFRYRAQVADDLADMIATKDPAVGGIVIQLRTVSFALRKKLDDFAVPTKEAVDSIRVHNNALLGTLSRLLASLEDDKEFRAQDNYKNIQTSIMSAENRIAVARKQFNEACKTVRREELSY